ncbi:glycosyltransferase family 2 protein [Pontibacter locisalis]|uniref:Glycosyltransferase family 2 protein n=1 Tax=Pontibacter locisalis TaxID=1719035 RepID=A0ABW5IQY2_9BACT
MLPTPSSPPVIHKVTPGYQRPLWSVMIPVYNCGPFLKETLESVLVQAPDTENMEIEVVDDASMDIDVQALVNEIGKGRIKYFRQEQNVGSLRNFATCINRSRGIYIHLLHGDDKVKEGYYKKIEQLFEKYPDAGAAFTRFRCINEVGSKIYEKTPEMYREGILPNWLLKIGEHQRIQYAAITVKREVYEKLGAFYGITYAEDWEMWVRIASNYSFAYTPEILAEYRKHQESITGSKIINGENISDLLKAMMLIQKHLPQDQKKKILKRSRKYYAAYALKTAKSLWDRLHDKDIVHTQVKQALHLYQSPKLYLMVLKLYLLLKLER